VSDRTSDMAISALAPWFGSKRTLAPLIVEELGDHHTYFEPFCGSMAVLLSKPKVRMEAVNDLHGDLINLARVIQHAQLGPALYRRCRRMWMVEGLFREAAARWKVRGVQSATESPDLDRAADFFFTSWVGRNGVVGTQSYNQSFAARYTPGGGHGGTRWQSAVGSIAAWRRRLEDVTVLNRDGFKLLTKIGDEPGVAVYCDPPYLVKGAEYVFDFKREDHARLAEGAGPIPQSACRRQLLRAPAPGRALPRLDRARSSNHESDGLRQRQGHRRRRRARSSDHQRSKRLTRGAPVCRRCRVSAYPLRLPWTVEEREVVRARFRRDPARKIACDLGRSTRSVYHVRTHDGL
jgi:DNA adenine methylase